MAMFALPKILAPVDFSERSPAGVRLASALACHFHSELTLLHVLERSMAMWGSPEFGATMVDEILESEEEVARQDLLRLLPNSQLNIKRVLLSGDPALQIVQFAHRENSSLIVIPTHGYGRFRRFLVGSVTAKALH